MRDVLMRLFFQDLDLHALAVSSISLEVDSDFEYGCYGVRCVDGEVTEVEYHNFSPRGNFHIESLPSTVRLLAIEFCQQAFEVNTRVWPRRLRTINLVGNDITGCPDLTTLPAGLEVAFLNNNEMVGPITLTDLPRNLGILDIHGNRIRQRVVFYDNLPESLHRVTLKGGNHIGEVQSVHPSSTVKQPDIFKNMRRSHIH
eukprot:CAMPEP_0201514050 /NCGR_PEP_ID=MMETSP0161_2-20130828/5978_1 /ASSEMBLY_ACC=CAM_ASM_000251 /TAXON_ID=180227 /ORGANISM="Neoparamoeba aestuarina, Strain SoJaBio B1-5/56/2" /LENGTH=199 /DNA_ID=CAMNT_0047910485 /DNA_START=90 /DNA_END=689 /DNA_ORIENTATION=+